MPRYFFHIEDRNSFHDEEGTVLPDASAARREASRVAAAYLRDHPADVWEDGSISVTVQDARGLTLFQVTVAGYDSPATKGGGYGPEDFIAR